MWVLSKSDYLSLESLKRLCKDLSKNSVKPLLSFVHSHCLQGKKGALQDQSFLEIVTPLRPQKILKFPLDSRSLTAAENERLPLHESNEKSLLRKSVADIAGELTR
jgi:Flp pilus assembly CpaE family ATPase